MTERDWTNPTPQPGQTSAHDGVHLSCLTPGAALLISGDLDQAAQDLAPGAPMLGALAQLPDTATAFVLRIARDRGLFCFPAQPDVAAGWHAAGYAISEAGDLYCQIQIGGARQGDLCDACLTTPPGSPSALVQFGGSSCLAALSAEGLRLWVPPSEAAALWLRLECLATGQSAADLTPATS